MAPTTRPNNADIAALAAPRPQLLISVTWRGEGKERRKDQSCNTPEVEFPYLRRVYRLLGAEDNVANRHLADEGHDYGFNKRVAAYSFCAKHLNLELTSIQNRPGQVDESFVRLLDEHDLAGVGRGSPTSGRPPQRRRTTEPPSARVARHVNSGHRSRYRSRSRV